MKRRLLAMLLVLGIIIPMTGTAFTASAAEDFNEPFASDFNENEKFTLDIPVSGDDFNSSNLISLLINNESEWLNTFTDTIQFIDFDFDGTPEFVVKDYYPSGQIWVYQLRDGELLKSNFFYGDDDQLSNVGENNTFKAMFDNTTGKYRMFGIYHKHNVSDPYYHEYESAELFFDGMNIESRVYSILHYDGFEFGTDIGKFVYYDGDRNVITKEEYNSINNKVKENCVAVNLTYNSYTMHYDHSGNTVTSNFSKMSSSEKRTTLEGLYNSFSYDKQEPANALDYTAYDLLRKPIAEIIGIMGGNYEIDGFIQHKIDHRTNHEWKQIYIYNNELLPGLRVYLPKSLVNENSFGTDGRVTDSTKGSLKQKLPSVSEKPQILMATNGAKVDDNISSDMHYNNLTKYYGDFDCVAADNLYGYLLTNDNGSIIGEFSFDSAGLTSDTTSATMKANNPKLDYVVIFSEYEPIDNQDNSVDYIKYVNDNIVSKYGIANFEKIDITMDMSASSSDSCWAARSGVLGYNITDLNRDGNDDLLVYIFDNSSGLNTIRCEYYPLYSNDTRTNSFMILRGKAVIYREKAYWADCFNAGFIEIADTTYLYTESFHHDIKLGGVYVEYNMYTVDESGDFYLKYTIRQSEPGSEVFAYLLTEYFREVSYENENGKTRKSVKVSSKVTPVWTMYSEYSIQVGVKEGLEQLITKESRLKAGEVIDRLGYTGYANKNTGDNPENFPSYSDIISQSFSLVNGPIDIDKATNKLCDYRSVLSSNGLSVISENNYESHVVIKGDVNGDSKITAKDSLLIQRYVIKLEQLNDTQLKAADVDKDGKVTNKDALKILRHTIGYKVEGIA